MDEFYIAAKTKKKKKDMYNQDTTQINSYEQGEASNMHVGRGWVSIYVSRQRASSESTLIPSQEKKR